MRGIAVAQAYRRSANLRTAREQDADVFLRVNMGLRKARQGSSLARTKAVADNERLWITLMDILRDPANPLPEPLRAAIVSVGHTVRREVGRSEPDLGFLIGINEQLAAGLSA